MAETLTFTPEQETSVAPPEDLGQLALQGAFSTAERGGFALSEDTEAELRGLFDNVSQEVEPLSAHGLGCDASTEGGTPHHAYLLPYHRMAEE